MTERAVVPVTQVEWRGVRRIIRSLFPPIDLFEDIADPADWSLRISAEQKTNPRLMETIGNIDLVPAERRVAGPGASSLMAPFTHVSPDRPSRFTRGAYGVLYVADRFETALAETIHHHERFMARTAEAAGWTSQFREIVLDVDVGAHDLRENPALFAAALLPGSYAESQAWQRTCALTARRASPIQAAASPTANASRYSTPIWRRTRSRDGTSTTIGMAPGSISSAR